MKKNNTLSRWFALVSIVPAALSIMASELIIWGNNTFHLTFTYIDPLVALGMLVPMGMMMELFTFFMSRNLVKKEEMINSAIRKVSDGDYSIRLEEDDMAPFAEVASAFNRMAEKLGSVETLRKDFTGNFSHEFKTPIVSINGFANLLLTQDVPPARQKEYLQIIADESDRLARLSKDTMLMSRLDTAVEINDVQTYALDDQIRQEIILLSDAWEKKNIDMLVDLEKTEYNGNKEMMAHVWINLISNAVKYTPENGTIAVTLKTAENNIVFSVKDSGIGMTQEQCAHVFERYWQADQSHSGKGLGLGLSIAQKIVQLCHGSIEVQSEYRKGSTFTVRLPKEA